MFALSTGSGGRLGFPEAEIAIGIMAGLVSVSIGASFGCEVGSVIRQRGEGIRLPADERSVLIVLGVVVVVVVTSVLLALADAILVGQPRVASAACVAMAATTRQRPLVMAIAGWR